MTYEEAIKLQPGDHLRAESLDNSYPNEIMERAFHLNVPIIFQRLSDDHDRYHHCVRCVIDNRHKHLFPQLMHESIDETWTYSYKDVENASPDAMFLKSLYEGGAV